MPDSSAPCYVFNFCRPNSSLNFTDSHEQATKPQENVHKSSHRKMSMRAIKKIMMVA